MIALAIGPLLGALLILLTDAPLPLLNIVAGIVYALTMPFVALTTSYAYFDVRVRDELEREQAPAIMPAEIALTSWLLSGLCDLKAHSRPFSTHTQNLNVRMMNP